MKITLSRNIFDTATGGLPSLMVDGRPISLPIPATRQSGAMIASSDFDTGFAIRRRVWDKYRDHAAWPLIEQALILGAADTTWIRRVDVFEAFARDTRLGIVATLVWGYPLGGFPKRDFHLLLDSLDIIAKRLDALTGSRLPAAELCARFSGIAYLGPSTFTKLLYFAGIEASEGRCLIYDRMVMREIAASPDPAWSEVAATVGSGRCHQERGYGPFLRAIHTIAANEGRPADHIEEAMYKARGKSQTP